MINMCSRLSVLGGLTDFLAARFSGLRDIDTCEDDGQNQAAWSTLRER